jgi:ligand-binding SRPBCC domain-containing protein
MKLYHFRQQQVLPVTMEEAWTFFSNPGNLARITPEKLGFEITFISGDSGEMYAGQLICYKVNVLPFLRISWMTEIKQVKEPYYFSDEQRFGPYSLWNHQHHFREVPDGIEMTDEIVYAVPFGVFGRLANKLFVRAKLQEIFAYREKILKVIYPNTMAVNRSA